MKSELLNIKLSSIRLAIELFLAHGLEDNIDQDTQSILEEYLGIVEAWRLDMENPKAVPTILKQVEKTIEVVPSLSNRYPQYEFNKMMIPNLLKFKYLLEHENPYRVKYGDLEVKVGLEIDKTDKRYTKGVSISFCYRGEMVELILCEEEGNPVHHGVTHSKHITPLSIRKEYYKQMDFLTHHKVIDNRLNNPRLALMLSYIYSAVFKDYIYQYSPKPTTWAARLNRLKCSLSLLCREVVR